MFANLLASAPADAQLVVASTTFLGLAGLSYRYLRLRSNERITIKTLETGERMHAREKLAEMHRNDLAADYGMHANQLDAELKAALLQARTEQYWAGATRGLPSFTFVPSEASSPPALTSETGRPVWRDWDIENLDHLHRVIGDSKRNPM